MSPNAKNPDPCLDFIPDDPAELRAAVTRMAAHINASDWQFLKMIAAMDRTRSWQQGGYCNLGNWLDHRCGLGPCAARERIRISRALATLPHIDVAFRDGIISYSKVRAITRVATPETDEMLLAIASRSSAAQLDSLVRTYERVGGKKRRSSEQQRNLTWHYQDGMLVVTAAVPAARGALLIKALQAVVDVGEREMEAHYQSLLCGDPEMATQDDAITTEAEAITTEAEVITTEADATTIDDGTTTDDGTTKDKAIGNVSAEAELLTPPAITNDQCRDVSPETDPLDRLAFQMASRAQRFADALVDIAEHYLASGHSPGQKRRTGQRYEVTLHIDRNQLAEQQPEDGVRYYVDPDWGIDEQEARQICCDADITEFIQDERGDFLSYERRRRIVPERLLRALKIRDNNRCCYPGCPHQRYLQAHHIRHWIDGGETCIDNMALVCTAHHTLLHHGAFHMTVQDGDIVFVSKDGEVIERTQYPQFPNVSAEAPGHLRTGNTAKHPTARIPRKPSVFESHSDHDIVDMLDFRENWGGKRRKRLWAQILR